MAYMYARSQREAQKSQNRADRTRENPRNAVLPLAGAPYVALFERSDSLPASTGDPVTFFIAQFPGTLVENFTTRKSQRERNGFVMAVSR